MTNGPRSFFFRYHIVSRRLNTSPTKSGCNQELPIPTDITSLQSFLGLAEYHRDFISNFAYIAGPFYNLLKKEVAWVWTDQHVNEFVKLEQVVMQAAVLITADTNKPYHL